ncbi:MAG: response regulator [Polyangiaceae bacterium]|nr:response regulator [Polyangiaceae bacterium]
MESAARSKLILVVDDDVRTARVLARMLRDDGFEAEIARDGAAAIARLSREPAPKVLITDLRMPHADGWAVARYARTQAPDICVFVITGYPERAKAWASGAGGATVLTKPVDYRTLSTGIREAVGDAV